VASTGGDTSVVPSGTAVPSQVKPPTRTTECPPDRGLHATSTNTARRREPSPVSTAVAVPSDARAATTAPTDSSSSISSLPTPSVANTGADPAVVDGIPVSVILVHRDDHSPCDHDLYCPRGRQPYCTRCDHFDMSQPCSHLRDYEDELDFEC
jgi:hypothetical protein